MIKTLLPAPGAEELIDWGHAGAEHARGSPPVRQRGSRSRLWAGRPEAIDNAMTTDAVNPILITFRTLKHWLLVESIPQGKLLYGWND